jgi:NAD-dependent dihydropyrimidine dehydrogenase PreA subunit
MSVRKIITIDAEKCNGCGLCIPNCPEGALRIIDGKARLVSDLFCDGLGACLGHCPEGAIAIEEREAVPYDEKKAMENISTQGANTIQAHLEHLRSHGEEGLLAQAVSYLEEKRIGLPEGFPRDSMTATEARAAAIDASGPSHAGHGSGCPGSRAMELAPGAAVAESPSALSNWPVQLHLISPLFAGKDVLLAADCVAYASGSFHGTWLSGKVLAIACPKLDDGADIYKEKITAMIDHARINTLTVMMMEVPCCRGLLAIAEQARAAAHRKIPLKAVVIGIKGGEVLSEQWL